MKDYSREFGMVTNFLKGDVYVKGAYFTKGLGTRLSP